MPNAAMPRRAPGVSAGRRAPSHHDESDSCPGVLRPHTAADGLLVRVRLPAGLLSHEQAAALGDAAERFADGTLSLTSRGNIELRGIAPAARPGLARLLDAAGLLPSAAHDRARNILGSPLSGLDGLGHADAHAWARRLDALLREQDWTAALSGRFLFAFDDGRGDLAALGADITLTAAADGTAVLTPGRHRVPARQAPQAALAGARAFLEAARGTGAWRMRDLPADRPPDIAAALRAAGLDTLPPGAVPQPPKTPGPPGPPLGAIRTPDGRVTLSVAARLGRVTAAQWRALPATPELRLTPWRGILLPGLAPSPARDLLAALAGHAFLTSDDSPWRGVGACTGRPGCAKSLADVRADATPRTGKLPVYWSGCERRCGHPHGDWVDMVATAGGGYRETVHGPAPHRTP